MLRERALKVVLVLLGLFFCAGICPIAEALWHPDASEDYGDYMMLSLYVTLGVFLLIAARNPSAHRSLIAFTAWSSFAHALVMGTMAFQFANQRVRSEEHTSELQSLRHLVCRLLLEKKNTNP